MSFGKPPKKSGDDLAGSGLTPQTQALLQDVMQKRGLSLRATQDVIQSVKEGDTAWVHRVSTGVAAFQPAASKTQTLVKVPKVGKAVYQPIPGPPASFSGKRMVIPTPERDMWVGGAPAPNREQVKEHCAQVMELGAKGLRELQQQQAAASQAAAAAAATAKPVNVREAMVDQLVQEVQERREFLEAMRAVGRGDEYDAQIRGEIQARMTTLAGYGVDTSQGARKTSSSSKAQALLPPWQRQRPGEARDSAGRTAT